MRRFWLPIVALLGIFSFYTPAFADSNVSGVVRARVVSVTDERIEQIPGTNTTTKVQTLKAEILEGVDTGKEIIVENDIVHLKAGDALFASMTVQSDGSVAYGLLEPDRTMSLVVLAGMFIVVIVVVGGRQGVRALLSLGITIGIVTYILIPGILHGLPVLAVAVLSAMLMLAIAMYATHGWNIETHAAFLGTSIAVLMTGLLGAWSVSASRLSGFSAEGSTYVNLITQGNVDFASLLLGAIILGAVGVLDDIAITQAEMVSSLARMSNGASRAHILREALHVGRAHIGALVNTLALAYAGAALPLLMLMALSPASLVMILNGELIATELIRTMVGSIGLALAMPLVTFAAVWMIVPATQKIHDTQS